MNQPHDHVFVAVYSGETISTARILAASADPEIVKFVAGRLAQTLDPGEIESVARARRRTLRRIASGGTAK